MRGMAAIIDDIINERYTMADKTIAVTISESAADAIRHKFNPSDSSDVAYIKDLTGTLITKLETIRERNGGLAGREAAVAITNIQTASMWAVLAATKGLK